MHSFDIVGYTYRAEQWTPEGVVRQLLAERRAAPAALDMKVEDVLDQIAGAEGIDREDERSFDSDEFPKVIFADQVEDPDELFADGVNGEYVSARDLELA